MHTFSDDYPDTFRISVEGELTFEKWDYWFDEYYSRERSWHDPIDQYEKFKKSKWLSRNFFNLSATVQGEITNLIVFEVPVETLALYAKIRHDSSCPDLTSKEWNQQEYSRILKSAGKTSEVDMFVFELRRFYSFQTATRKPSQPEMILIATAIILDLREKYGEELVTLTMRYMYENKMRKELHEVAELVRKISEDYSEYPLGWAIEAVL